MSNNFSYLTKTLPDSGKYDDVRNYACILIDCYTEVQNVGTVDTLTVFFSVNKIDDIFRQTYTVTGYKQIIIVPVYPYYKLDIESDNVTPTIKRYYTSFYSVNPIPSLMNGTNNGNGNIVNNFISANNSTSTALLAGETFNGVFEDVTNYAEIVIYVNTDESGSLLVYFSSDITNYYNTNSYTVVGSQYKIPVLAKYFRISYTNGGTPQSLFKLQTILHANITSQSSKISSSIGDDTDCVVGKNVLAGKFDNGTFNTLSVTNSGYLRTTTTNVISTVNSSSTPLLAGAAFTGTGESVYNYKEIAVYVYSNIISAVNGLSLEFSSDGTNWDFKTQSTIAAATGGCTRIAVSGQYFRVVYTNSGTNQASFRLQTIYFAN